MKIAAAALAGILAFLSFPPRDGVLLPWVALAPWLFVLHRASVGSSVARSAAFALALLLPLGAWIPDVAIDGFGASWLAGRELWLVTCLSYAPAIIALGAALARVPIDSSLYPLVAGAGWGAIELSHSFVWPGIPWVVLGATQIDMPLAPVAAVGGVHLLSAIVVAGNALLAQAFARVPLRTLAWEVGTTAVFAVGASVVGDEYGRAPSNGTLRIAAVQPGVGLGGRGSSRTQRAIVAAAEGAIRDVRGPRLFVFPENFLNSTLESRKDLVARMSAAAAEREAVFLFGVHRRSSAGRLNSIALVRAGGLPEVVYDKIHLLPIAEAIPSWLPARLRKGLGRLVPLRSFRAGELHEPQTGLPARIGFTICYEAAFSLRPLDPSAQLLVNIVNDSWYDTTPAAEHLLLLSRWRAVEQGAPLVRAALTGVTGVVAPDGSFRGRLPAREPGVLAVDLDLPSTTTLFERFGHAPLLSLFLVGALWRGA